MKNSKKLKLTLMILICTLIILIGFLGIYFKRGNSYKNILPEYKLASDLTGSTILEFEIDDSTNTKYYDRDGKEVASTEVTEKNEKDYKKEEIPVNAKENLTEENYEKVVSIMKQRLNFLKADQYKIDLDKKSGKIVLTFEDDYPDDIKLFLQMEGKLEIVDSTTEEVVLTYTDFTKAQTDYAVLDNGKYVVYLNFKLNEFGLDKINNIDKYKAVIDSESNQDKENKGKILFDGELIEEVSYNDFLLKGKTLRITTAKDLESNSEINSKLNTSTIVSKLATFGKLPVVYNITAEEYINSNVANYLNYIIIGIGVITITIFIYLIIRYRFKGLLSVISFAANAALFLILIRITKIQMSLNGLAGLLGLIVLNALLIDNILKCINNDEKTFSENIKSAYLKTIDAIIVMLIIFAVFAFSKMTVISSTGLLVFWGWTVIILGNLMLTVPMLSIVNKK